MSVKPSIIPLDPVDIQGIEPMADELVNEETIGWISSIDINAKNSVNDSMLMKEYEQFLNSTNNEPIVVTMNDVKFDNLASGTYYDEVDFKPDMSLEKELITVEDPNKYYVTNPLWVTDTNKKPWLPPRNVYISDRNANFDRFNHCGRTKVQTSKPVLGMNEKISFTMSDFKYRAKPMNDGRRIFEVIQGGKKSA